MVSIQLTQIGQFDSWVYLEGNGRRLVNCKECNCCTERHPIQSHCGTTCFHRDDFSSGDVISKFLLATCSRLNISLSDKFLWHENYFTWHNSQNCDHTFVWRVQDIQSCNHLHSIHCTSGLFQKHPYISWLMVWFEPWIDWRSSRRFDRRTRHQLPSWWTLHSLQQQPNSASVNPCHLHVVPSQT